MNVYDRLPFINKDNFKILQGFTTTREFCNNPYPRIGTWQRKVDIYAELQKLCTHPAYFWTCYRHKLWTLIPSATQEVSLDEVVNLGLGFLILTELKSGKINPQEFCNSY